jgi:hypothetical protein
VQPISTYDAPSAAKHHSVPVSITSKGDHLHNSENHQFTYKELENFTNKFERSIGQGGFGPVYYGRLEDDTEVAVKMRSETSSHGLDEFLADVLSSLVEKIAISKVRQQVAIIVCLHGN